MVENTQRKKKKKSLSVSSDTKLFYEDGYRCIPKTKHNINIGNPKEIYNFLSKRVYKQDSYCKDAALILYNHARGIPSRNFCCGPPGNGKSYVWQLLQTVYPNIIIVDSSNITRTGWSGENKITSFLQQIDPSDPKALVVFDEFDKLCKPQYTSQGENVSANTQSELLMLCSGTDVSVKRESSNIQISTKSMTFVFCGSFAEKAEQISNSRSTSGLGFGAVRTEYKPFDTPLTIQDLIDFGVIPELASRATRISNIRPLTLDDYVFLLTRHRESPLKKIEKTYNRKLDISRDQLKDIAHRAYESGLGIRNATAQLQQMMDDQLFSSFNETPNKKAYAQTHTAGS